MELSSTLPEHALGLREVEERKKSQLDHSRDGGAKRGGFHEAVDNGWMEG